MRSFSGIQYAGGHLQELQKAIKAPIANFGVVFGEVTKRGKSAIGIGKGNVLGDLVHPNLSEEASNVCASIDIFGASIEKILMRRVFSKFEFIALDTYSKTAWEEMNGLTQFVSNCTDSFKLYG